MPNTTRSPNSVRMSARLRDVRARPAGAGAGEVGIEVDSTRTSPSDVEYVREQGQITGVPDDVDQPQPEERDHHRLVDGAPDPFGTAARIEALVGRYDPDEE